MGRPSPASARPGLWQRPGGRAGGWEAGGGTGWAGLGCAALAGAAIGFLYRDVSAETGTGRLPGGPGGQASKAAPQPASQPSQQRYPLAKAQGLVGRKGVPPAYRPGAWWVGAVGAATQWRVAALRGPPAGLGVEAGSSGGSLLPSAVRPLLCGKSDVLPKSGHFGLHWKKNDVVKLRWFPIIKSLLYDIFRTFTIKIIQLKHCSGKKSTRTLSIYDPIFTSVSCRDALHHVGLKITNDSFL